MPSGHTSKQTLTGNRRRLLEIIAKQGSYNRGTCSQATRVQLNAMISFGWCSEDKNYMVTLTEAGRKVLGEK